MRKGKSLASFFIIPLVIGLVILVGISASLYYLGIEKPLETQAKQLLETRLAERANLIQQRFGQIQNALTLSADSVFGEDDKSVSQKIKKQVPQLDNVVLFDSTTIQPSKDTEPAITHVIIDLLRQADKGNTVPPELILDNGQPSYVAFVDKLADERLLLATLNLNEVGNLLGDADNHSRIELRQNFGDVSHTVASVGTAEAEGKPLLISPSFGANWTLALWQKISRFSTDAGKLPLLMFIAALAAFFIVGLLPLMSMNRLFKSDARNFIQGVKEGAASEKKYQLSYFNELAAGYSRVAGRPGRGEESESSPEVEGGDDALEIAEQAESPQEQPAGSLNEMDRAEILFESGSDSEASSLFVVDEEDISKTISPEIFREYDIRGVVGDNLNAEVVYVIGKAIGSEAYSRGEQSIVVGRDGRLSSPELHAALIEGLQASGRDVLDLGMVTTPLVYFATHTLNSRSGVMLTGSHNPARHNGLKVVLAGETLHGEQIQELLNRIQTQEFFSGNGQVSQVSVEQDYMQKITADIQLEKPLKVAVDCGNGVAGEFAPKLLQALGCDVIGLYTEVDGNFPNHHPDPNHADNLQALIEMVVSEKADIGIAFDGDGDRLGVIDNQGKVIWTDRLMMLFAKDVLSRNPEAEIIYDVKCTRLLRDVIEQSGGQPLMWKTGHSLMKAKMRETEAPLGGEGSGHIYFNERWFGFDDALYAAARLLQLLDLSGKTSSEMFSELPEGVSSEEINVPIPDKIKFKLIKALVVKGDFGQGKVSTIDGLRVDYEDRWFLARASNTTPSIVVKFEAESEVALEAVKDVLRQELLKIAPKLKLNF
ncbi:phosphomannomutase/phosphoglucomutase [Kangiella sediminilitoris]|uniref:phosphomannomutase n=1 Tax=Kangiella sediminilitoris TaxID=1144748 RepID=A0A1B3B8L3_9GAMM|nr:phosphomannomutase/phosphoglucomutase [Kangiella sediminilitoris]AOE49111.1 Phosphomannomutase [Kangiella sediminilitoris]